MKIGFDVDGVLANFNPGYIQQCIDVTGRNLFLPGDDVNPPVWDFAGLRGYTIGEMNEAKKSIKESSDFWQSLPGYADNCEALAKFWFQDWNGEHDVYFITHRGGVTAKVQTERWLMYQGIDPTVLIVGAQEKGNVARALSLDVYVDDYYPNCEDVVRTSPLTRCYVLDRAYNRTGISNANFTVETRRVTSLEQLLRQEKLIA